MNLFWFLVKYLSEFYSTLQFKILSDLHGAVRKKFLYIYVYYESMYIYVYYESMYYIIIILHVNCISIRYITNNLKRNNNNKL